MTTCQRPTCQRKPHPHAHGYCRTHAYAEGILQTRVNAEPARQHVQKLLDAGATKSAIARAAGISRPTMTKLCAGCDTISARTHKSIMAITAPPTPGILPALAYGRRIRALRAAGHTLNELVEATGLYKTTIVYLSTNRWETITKSTADKIRHAYDQLAYKPVRPASPRVAKYNWPLPMDWDDIDDPEEQPTPGRTAASGYIHRRIQLLTEEIGNPTRTAKYIGVTPKVIKNLLNGDQRTVSPTLETKINRAYYTWRTTNYRRQHAA